MAGRPEGPRFSLCSHFDSPLCVSKNNEDPSVLLHKFTCRRNAYRTRCETGLGSSSRSTQENVEMRHFQLHSSSDAHCPPQHLERAAGSMRSEYRTCSAVPADSVCPEVLSLQCCSGTRKQEPGRPPPPQIVSLVTVACKNLLLRVS